MDYVKREDDTPTETIQPINNSTYKQFKITQHLCGGIWCCDDNQGQIAQKSAYYLKSSMETYMGKEIPWKT